MRVMRPREQGLEPVQGRRSGTGRHVIGGQFVGGADGFAPGIGAEGVDIFALARCRVWTRAWPSRERKKIYHRGHRDRSTENTESYCVALRSAAVAGVGEGERTHEGTVLAAIGGHGSPRKKGSICDFWGSLAEARRTSKQEQSTRMVITLSMEVLGRVKLSSSAAW